MAARQKNLMRMMSIPPRRPIVRLVRSRNLAISVTGRPGKIKQKAASIPQFLEHPPCRISPGGYGLFLYVFLSLSLVDARVNSAVRIRCRPTTGHSIMPVKPPAKPT